MKKVVLIFAILLSGFSLYAQTGVGDDFESGPPLSSAWDFTTYSTEFQGFITSAYNIPKSPNKQLFVHYKTINNSYDGIMYNFSPINMFDAPYVSLKIQTSTAFTLRIDLVDVQGRSTNKIVTQQSLSVNSKSTDYLFDFSNKFLQQYPNSDTIDYTKITRIVFMINPGNASTTGTFLMDSLMVGSRAKSNIVTGSKGIKLNQLGFFVNGPKKAVVNGGIAGPFYIVNQVLNDTVYKGTLSASKTWSYSSESVRIADFSDFKKPGTYRLRVPGINSSSYPFTISSTPLSNISKGSIKGFYYQRASMALNPQYAGIWARAAGHPDNHVLIHNSAASSPNRATGSIISSPRGWYDAGDYNKYIVNSGISTFTLLACYEHFSTYYDTISLNIPESTNSIPDVLDEALYNVRWMLTMQDPGDGGVYHKLTNANFDGDNVMPANATNTRYVVQKSTGATLDFSAVMAQASRIFSQFPFALPGLADSCLNASKKAYEWGILNFNMPYNQSTLSNPAITTGDYGDNTFTDESNWAAAELFTTTRLAQYYNAIDLTVNADIPGWQNVYTLGLISLAHNRVLLGANSDSTKIKNKVISAANAYRDQAMTGSAYGIAMGAYSWNFGWGSNSTAANQAMILIQAFNYTKDSSYLKAATSNVDYLLGRNGLNYSFVTGYGSISPKNPHHRISQADGIVDPIPGLLVGGPNSGQQDNCPGYTSFQAALSYVDSDCSYSTNEIAINWNAPLAYITGAIQSIYSGIEPSAIDYSKIPTSTTNAIVKNIIVHIYPNPTNSVLNVEKPFELISKPTILDLNGQEYEMNSDWSSNTFQINTSQLSQGMYLIRLQGENGTAIQKFTVIK
jgi:endoglucanase